MRRSDQRRDAVFALYQRDVTGKASSQDERVKAFTRELIDGVDAHRDELDEQISRHARGWTLDRISPLDRNIMRVALFEVAYQDDVPTEVALDEAIEIAKQYSGADAPGFINGVLGAAVREAEPSR